MVRSLTEKNRITEDSLLTPVKVALWLSVSPDWVRDHAIRRQPRLRTVKLGKLLRFRVGDVRKFIQERGR